MTPTVLEGAMTTAIYYSDRSHSPRATQVTKKLLRATFACKFCKRRHIRCHPPRDGKGKACQTCLDRKLDCDFQPTPWQNATDSTGEETNPQVNNHLVQYLNEHVEVGRLSKHSEKLTEENKELREVNKKLKEILMGHEKRLQYVEEQVWNLGGWPTYPTEQVEPPTETSPGQRQLYCESHISRLSPANKSLTLASPAPDTSFGHGFLS